MNPSADVIAAGAPIDFDLTPLAPGQQVIVLWRGAPIVVCHTPDMVKTCVSRPCSPSWLTRIPRRGSNRLTRATGIARSIPNTSCSSASARISAASRNTSRSRVAFSGRRGPAAIFVRATARNTTWPAASLPESRHRTICRSRPTTSPIRRPCGSARTRKARPSTSHPWCRCRLNALLGPS